MNGQRARARRASAAAAERRARAAEATRYSGSAVRRRAYDDQPAGRAAVRAPRAPARRQALLPPGVTERRALLLVVLLLLLYGLVMAYSASAALAYFQHGSTFHLVGRQVAFAGLGLAALAILSRVDYAWYRRMAVPLACVALALLVLVLVPGIGTSVNGARRWIIVSGVSLQPSELAKLAAVTLVASLIAARPGEVARLRHFLLLAGIGVVPAAALIMLEPDLGSTLVLLAGVGTVLVAGGAKMRHVTAMVAFGIAAVFILIISADYRLARLTTFLDPWKDPQGTGFQATQSLLSFASGGFFGVGLGNSVQKFGFLPEQDTDMITAIIGEELGVMGLGLLMVLYVALAWIGLRIAINCKETFGKLLATGIVAVIIGQACLNIGAALGVVPLTGVPLPLVSLGGTSLVVLLAALGILLNIATNRRSFIVASPHRSPRPRGGGGHRRPSAAGARGRG